MTEPTGGAGFNTDTDGGNDSCICTVIFQSPEEDGKFVKRAKSQLLNVLDLGFLNSNSYKSQFSNAFYGNGSPEEAGEGSLLDKIIHWITLPWKLICAFIPPTTYGNGWLTFYGGLFIIMVQTGFVGDIAESIGCNLGIPDKITGLTLVGLGTSLPDTFGSKTGAEQDENGDSSITNVTGSNSVNVFLGSGLTWTMGSLYWWYQFEYEPNGAPVREWYRKTRMKKAGTQVRDNWECIRLLIYSKKSFKIKNL